MIMNKIRLVFSLSNNKRRCDTQDLSVDEDNSATFSTFSSSSSRSTTKVRFANHDDVYTVPSRDELNAHDLWWQGADLRRTERDLAAFVVACQDQLDKCPRVLGDKRERAVVRDLQALVHAMEEILSNKNSSSNWQCQTAAQEQLCNVMGRAPAIRSMERCLLTKKRHRAAMDQHVRQVCCRSRRWRNKNKRQQIMAQSCSASSASSVRLALALGRSDEVQAQACWNE